MPVITLTTDYGNSDIYLPVLKGMLMSHCPEATLIEISNQVAPYSVYQAGFLVKNAYPAFAKNTVHLILVDEHPEASDMLLLAHCNGHYFLYPDNGLTGLLFEPTDKPEIFSVAFDSNENRPAEVLSRVAGFLARGGKPNLAGKKTETWQEAKPWLPTYSHLENRAQITGRVLHIDHYGNLITNISHTYVKQHLGENAIFVRTLRMRDKIKLVKAFRDVKKDGSTFAIFQESGHLAIGIFKSVSQDRNSAYSLLGLKVGDTIILERG